MVLLDVALLVLAATFVVGAARLAVGPTEPDRLLGLDLGFAVLVGTIALLAVRAEQPVLLDLVLVATFVGFLATVAVARLVSGRRG